VQNNSSREADLYVHVNNPARNLFWKVGSAIIFM